MANLPFPPRVELALLPTPLQPLPRLSAELGAQVLCKRDDLTGAVLSGNKVRKLELLLRQALDQGCGSVITCGGEQSNHARATAVAARRLGLGCHLLLRTADPARPPAAEANVLLDRLVGAEIRWIDQADYARRDQLLEEQALEAGLRQGVPCYAIPEGGSNALGAWGYVGCVQELARQHGPAAATVVCAVGSGGTLAGLLAGVELLGLPWRVVGVCVTDDRATFQRRVAGILGELERDYGLAVSRQPAEIEVWQDYVGLGYAVSRAEELRLIARVARSEGIILDPVYTGKAMYGLVSELRAGQRLPEPVIFLHTGGVFGLFAKSSQLREVL